MQLELITATRICKRCGIERPMTEYHVVALCKGGRRAVCIPCVSAESRARYQEDLEGNRKKNRERMNERHRIHGAPLKPAEQMKEWKRRNPEKAKAHQLVNDRIRRGKMARGSCEVCDAPNAHAHHDDYSRPLDVRWLCRTHHMEYHRLNRGD